MEWKKGLCGVCPAGCWVDVGMSGGRIEDIRPDAGHTLGNICRRGQHAPEIVYSEHRLAHPMRRTGPKGSLSFESIGWVALALGTSLVSWLFSRRLAGRGGLL